MKKIISVVSDPGNWRAWDIDRPWYRFAQKLIVSKREKILEAGAGNGEFAEILRKHNKDVIAADNSTICLERLKKSGFKTVKSDFTQRLPFGNNYFDGVSALEVIEHIPRAEFLMREFARILKKNGWLVISTPNISWIGYRFLSLFGALPFKEGYHLRYFNYHTLAQKLAQANFTVAKTACFTPLPYINRIRQYWIPVSFWPNLLAQDLVFLCYKKTRNGKNEI